MKTPLNLRIGCGVDAHAFAAGRELILGGVRIPNERGLAAHSDGDALCHALCDALLGACALGDIGGRFPPDDPQYKNADSVMLLAETARFVREARGASLLNADATVVAQAPKIAEYVPAMRRRLAAALAAAESQISIKATTTDYLGFAGRGEGVAVFAVALVNVSDG